MGSLSFGLVFMLPITRRPQKEGPNLPWRMDKSCAPELCSFAGFLDLVGGYYRSTEKDREQLKLTILHIFS